MTVDVFAPNRGHHFDEIVALDVDTVEGRYGILERHIDTAMALDAGLLHMRDRAQQEHYVGLDGGILVKVGSGVRICTARVIVGQELGVIEEGLQEQQDEGERKDEHQLRAFARLELQLSRSITGAEGGNL
ncbi:MAG: hypothetical protein ACOCW6_03805 [Spirochaetota bacterium]